jgi:hypothetical protein
VTPPHALKTKKARALPLPKEEEKAKHNMRKEGWAKKKKEARPGETRTQRADRHLSELLQELRVALPGAQVLFAFLLTVPFAARFGELDDVGEYVYFGVLLCTAISVALLIAPSAAHRILFRQRDKEFLVDLSNRYALAGLAFLALAITGAVWVVSDLLFARPVTAVTVAFIAILFVVIWFVEPIRRRSRLGRKHR